MAFLQRQKTNSGSISLSLAEAVYRKGQKPAQRRFTLGTFDDASQTLRVNRNLARRGETIPLATLQEHLAKGDLRTWISGTAARSTAPIDGLAPDPKSRTEAEKLADVASVTEDGPWHVLEEIAKDCGLLATLETSFGKELGLQLFAIASHQVCSGSPLYFMQSWAADQPLPFEIMKADFSSPALSILMAQLGRDLGHRDDFNRNWIKALGSPQSLVYDLTSISTYSSHPLSQWGYNRDNEKLPQLNLALVADTVTGLPLLLRALPGSISDTKTLKLTSDILESYGLKKFGYRLDRAFYSAGNVRDMLSSGLAFTMTLKIGCAEARELLADKGASLLQPMHGFLNGERVVRHAVKELDFADSQGKKHRCGLHLYMDPSRRSSMMADLERRCMLAMNEAAELSFKTEALAKEWIEARPTKVKNCFKVSEFGKGKKVLWRIERDDEAAAEVFFDLGYQVTLSSDPKLSGKVILEDYGLRDHAEKLLDIHKNENGNARLRTGDPMVAEGRLFVSTLALILHQALQRRMKDAGLLKSYSVAELLAMLRSLRCIRTPGFVHPTEAPKKCRDALKALNIELPR
jgi:hypothetical protein